MVLVQRAQAEMQDGKLFDKVPKSAAGVRPVAFPDEILADVIEYVGPQGGQLQRSTFRDDWIKARKDAGIAADVHFHDLRHTGNTLAAAGASTRELMTRTDRPFPTDEPDGLGARGGSGRGQSVKSYALRRSCR
ncbi:tyrosine-type recombinase/integrase [Streptomyces sp. NBC_01637]|uniref:tyrosine-type recombinase/integrase n=1 Tax=unclassified Streptomyces TaxID=2593676 RepID=UPI00386324E6|nr:tyrosine-type recombinase/integrase [Streptomyces sp. NBC_01653]WTD93201.1 tyrosine-type recombinase/integrase [Streptomyces sp. NBC_01637]